MLEVIQEPTVRDRVELVQGRLTHSQIVGKGRETVLTQLIDRIFHRIREREKIPAKFRVNVSDLFKVFVIRQVSRLEEVTCSNIGYFFQSVSPLCDHIIDRLPVYRSQVVHIITLLDQDCHSRYWSSVSWCLSGIDLHTPERVSCPV